MSADLTYEEWFVAQGWADVAAGEQFDRDLDTWAAQDEAERAYREREEDQAVDDFYDGVQADLAGKRQNEMDDLR